MRVRAEDVRENRFPFVDFLQFRLAVLERREVVVAVVHRATLRLSQHLVIRIRPEHRNNDGGQRNQHNQNQADGRDLVLQQALHAVAEKGRGRPHPGDDFLFLRRRGHEGIHIQMQAKGLFLVHHHDAEASLFVINAWISHLVEQVADQIHNHD